MATIKVNIPPPRLKPTDAQVAELMAKAKPHRDTHKTAVYRWEDAAYGFTPLLDPAMAQALIALVHSDVIRLVGDGAAHPAPTVLFDRRNDGASARWGVLHFNPRGARLETVLHEIGHSLTWNGQELFDLAARKLAGAKLAYVQHHLSFVLCDRGHGPRYVACLIALMERYAGRSHVMPLRCAKAREVPVDDVALDYWRRIFQL